MNNSVSYAGQSLGRYTVRRASGRLVSSLQLASHIHGFGSQKLSCRTEPRSDLLAGGKLLPGFGEESDMISDDGIGRRKTACSGRSPCICSVHFENVVEYSKPPTSDGRQPAVADNKNRN